MIKKLIPLFVAVGILVLLALGQSAEPSDPMPQTPPSSSPPATTVAVDRPVAFGDCTATVYWSLSSDGTLTLSGTGDVPDFEKGANNQPWIQHWKSITALVIEDGVTRIGDRAFQGFSNLKSAAFGADVAEIGQWAFQNCTSLETVYFLSDVKPQTGAFRGTPVEWDVSGMVATAYTNSRYFDKLSKVTLTGNYRDDIINIALSQEGYHEGNSEKDYGGGNAKGTKDYTEYGRRLDSSGTAWCSEFACWCIRMAGVPTQAVSNSWSANVATFTAGSSADFYSWDTTVFAGGSYTPRKGDLLLWAWDKKSHSTEENLGHTSILWEIKKKKDGTVLLKTIDGNSNNQVQVRQYTVNAKDGTLIGRKGSLCYIVAPDYEA